MYIACRASGSRYALGPYTPVDPLCEAYLKVARCLTAYFQFGEFRPGQLETLMAVLHGTDVFVRLPTGGGKSLCMFLAHDPDTVV